MRIGHIAMALYILSQDRARVYKLRSREDEMTLGYGAIRTKYI